VAPKVKVGMKIPEGIGDEIARIINRNFKRQNMIKLNPTDGVDQYNPSINRKLIFFVS
jgi:hypothetical protein